MEQKQNIYFFIPRRPCSKGIRNETPIILRKNSSAFLHKNSRSSQLSIHLSSFLCSSSSRTMETTWPRSGTSSQVNVCYFPRAYFPWRIFTTRLQATHRSVSPYSFRRDFYSQYILTVWIINAHLFIAMIFLHENFKSPTYFLYICLPY